jgi:glycosyltransferase involved in cell wall biosynthesis
MPTPSGHTTLTSRIAFLGLGGSFDYCQVGGMDSLVRRLAASLAARGCTVDLVLYGASEAGRKEVDVGVIQRTFVGFEEAVQYLKTGADHVISVYLRPRERWTYARFRRDAKDAIKFHHLYATWNESVLKRSLLFAEPRLWPFNGHLFCVSPRICRQVSKWSGKATLLLPPVPAGYFCDPCDKPDHGTLRVAYAGRLDVGKGAADAVDTLRRLAGRRGYELSVYGYAWPSDSDGMRLHERLLAEANIQYKSVDFRRWSPDVDAAMRECLRATDILLLPYRRLSSTVDMPLLLLEGMASLCVVITPRQGDLHETYGSEDFAFAGSRWDASAVARLIEERRSCVGNERRRLKARAAALGFEAQTVAHRLLECLSED